MFFGEKCRREKCRAEKCLWGKLSCTPFSNVDREAQETTDPLANFMKCLKSISILSPILTTFVCKKRNLDSYVLNAVSDNVFFFFNLILRDFVRYSFWNWFSNQHTILIHSSVPFQIICANEEIFTYSTSKRFFTICMNSPSMHF